MYEIIRKSLIITLCLVVSKLIHLNVSVFIVVFSIILATTCYSRHIVPQFQRLLPSVAAACGAVFINQLFAEHPFVIWTVSIMYFDYVRRKADNNLKIAVATLPLFMIIFISTYHNTTSFTLAIPNIIRDVVFSAMIAALIASFVNHVLPVRGKPPPMVVTPISVTGADRLKLLVLVGGGLSFIMINEVTSAVFCLVPLITSAMQPTHSLMKSHSQAKLISQVGGCSMAIIMSFAFSGTEVNIFTYLVVSFCLVLTILYWMSHPRAIDIHIHRDALMGFLIPYQLYVAKDGNDFGLNSITLRAVELFIALMIIYVLSHWLDHLALRNVQKHSTTS